MHSTPSSRAPGPMGDYGAIAAVSETLQWLLERHMQTPGRSNTPHEVTLQPPDEAGDDVDGDVTNLFLFHVDENPQLKNQAVPEPGSGFAGPPPLSLELHYLLTCYTSGDPTRAQDLLGDAMQVLHTYPDLTRELEEHTPSGGGSGATEPPDDANGDPPGHSAPELLEQREDLKVTVEPLGLEEASSIWTAFTVPYRLSVAYKVTVVQIESRRGPQPPRLVGPRPEAGPRAYVTPFDTPRIAELRVLPRKPGPGGEWIELGERPYTHARIGDRLVVLGDNLSVADRRVIVGGVDVTDEGAGDRHRLELTLPDASGLGPGPVSVHLEQDVIEREEGPPSVVRSNAAVFMLVPRVTGIEPDDASSPDVLTVTGSRLHDSEQENHAFVGPLHVEGDEYLSRGEAEIKLDVSSLGPGDHPVRIRVGRAESVDDVSLTVR